MRLHKLTLPPVNRFFPLQRNCEWLLLAFWISTQTLLGGVSLQRDVCSAGIAYTNEHVAAVPWSIHVVRVERSDSSLKIHSIHAGKKTLGLSPLSAQIGLMDPSIGNPVAAINGDFFHREIPTGVPRGLQIANGEVLSPPTGRVVFWIDAKGQPHATNVMSRFQIAWSGGATTPCGLNEDPRSSAAVIYTPAMAHSTHVMGGQELILEKEGRGPWLPLRMEETYKARVRAVRTDADAPLASGEIVLSLSPVLIQGRPPVGIGAVVKISTFSLPRLRAVETAVGGGPVLVRDGMPTEQEPPSLKSYTLASFLERNPRTAIGWNKRCFFLVEVDGRQKYLSAGMTLEELSAFMIKLGCDYAVNLDGGGSSTLWWRGKVMNSPSDGRERDIANALIVVRKRPDGGKKKRSSP